MITHRSMSMRINLNSLFLCLAIFMRFYSRSYKRESINDPFHPLFRSIHSHLILISASDKKCDVVLNLIVSCQINKHVEDKNTTVELKKLRGH